MPDASELSDAELLDELAAADDPDDVIQLRALVAQRGLHNAALRLPAQERRRIAEERGYVS